MIVQHVQQLSAFTCAQGRSDSHDDAADDEHASLESCTGALDARIGELTGIGESCAKPLEFSLTTACGSSS
eukprot:3209016-Amphidinium_carterae.1